MFIQTEPTPNPNTMKFLPGREIAPEAPREFTTPEEAEMSALAKELFAVDGVTGVFCGADYVSVSKDETVDWPHIKPAIFGALMDVLQSGAPLFADSDGEAEYDADSGPAKEIKEIIDTRVRPAVARDGGDIIFKGFDQQTGVVALVMRGACAGCPSSTLTLKAGIENLLKHYVPEVREVVAVG
ncbi:NifU family protein [Hyphobacterium sp. HN65]|uniref:NifU family protein n=1 Tax=Hyphobacterium lacteum TaxID=3116575 RepID=A0ABU7LS06_9PROT|nr:NifU family protein [Hyphobacterium sp. HN65]MEE2526684.1 NifU family protein [Hyphobacterium sp. HN65]